MRASATIPGIPDGEAVPVIIEQALNRVQVRVERTTRGPKWEIDIRIYDQDTAKAAREAQEIASRVYQELDIRYS